MAFGLCPGVLVLAGWTTTSYGLTEPPSAAHYQTFPNPVSTRQEGQLGRAIRLSLFNLPATPLSLKHTMPFFASMCPCSDAP